MVTVTSTSPQETKRLAAAIAKQLRGGEILALSGNLGSGKTTFVKGLARALGVKRPIASPTFVLLTPHRLPGKRNKILYHLDLYRLRDPRELHELGFRELLRNPDALMVIEWPHLAKRLLPNRTVRIKFEHGHKPNERIITLTS